MQLALILLIGQFGLNEARAESAPAANISSALAAKAQELIKSAMKVIQEDEGLVSMQSPGHSFAPKTQMLFFRKRGSRIEMIATGVFNSERVDAKTGKKELTTDLDRDNIIKYPHAGDYAVPMTDPNLAALDGKDGDDFPAPVDEVPKDEGSRPGYFEFGMGLMFGNFNTLPSGQVNLSKISSGYRFPLTHIAYYSDYVPIGFELDTYKGNFPTGTYKHTITTSGEKVSNIGFNYRFKPLFKHHLAFMARVNSISETFTTNNTDDSLLNTTTTGLGFGLRVQLDLVSPVWKKEPHDFFIQMQSFFGEYLYYPSITANDTAISRGLSSSGSTLTQYRVGATALAWISFIPLLKRWVIQGSYGMRSYNLKFSGATVSEPGNPILVLPNSSSKESEKDYRFFVGFRIEDPIKLLFGNDDKKEN
jgi:hypothetical protein